jgi:ribosomal protein S18 acetylase RimI-like enzyme
MELVVASKKHFGILAEMNQQLIQDEGHRNSMNLEQLNDRMGGWLSGVYEAALFVETEVLGYALWRNEEEVTYLRQFFIQRGCRRKSIGTEAFRLLESSYWQGSLLRLEVLSDNMVARRFWQSLGFKQYCVTLEKNL